TDAAREGELIFRLVYQQCGCTKPVKRLWISSMEESAIRRGFETMRDSAEYDNLYQAALCRQRADWLVGINATRLFSLLCRGKTLNVGRVMTPTLSLLAEREAAITGFQKEKFYTVELALPGFRAVSGRFASKADAEKLCANCSGTPAVVRTVDRQDKTERPPKLYDLTTLQREANRLCGFTAQQTLDGLQSLYEKKLATYPRTDSRYLTEDMADGLPELCGKAAKALPFVLDLPLSVNASLVVDNSKVSDHHAVIPTVEIAKADLSALPDGERTILHMIAVRLLCAVGELRRYAETAVTLDCGGASFTAKGRTVTAEGWKAIEKAFLDTLKQHNQEKEPAPPLPLLNEGEAVQSSGAAVKEGTTKPPQHFTEDTLLSAMERASAEEAAGPEAPEHAGLGTPATRAGIIEKLVRTGFVQRKNRQMIPTAEGIELIRILPEPLKSARLTAEWEEKLRRVERGELDGAVFLAGIVSMLEELVRDCGGAEIHSPVLSGTPRPVVGTCPRCGRNVVEGPKSFYCEGYRDQPPCAFALWKDNKFFSSKGKQITKRVAEKLLRDGCVHMRKLHSEKKGTDYDATIVMEDTGGKYVNFRLEFDRK
ncbi:MAG: DNA topoisomerase III, partial [Oscillibacter sp.]|nr:DNA topoisomerase III [Oscillibacter sp.]